ncbi:hypothetical protein OAJ39_01265 [Alphaproteobacteria bacterium]|nr:hypothetical protein [Alphaproteobacteria bacterium]
MAPTSSFKTHAWQIDPEGSHTENCIAQERLKSPLNNGENTSIKSACTVHWILDPLRWRLPVHGIRDPFNKAVLIGGKVNILKAKLGFNI